LDRYSAKSLHLHSPYVIRIDFEAGFIKAECCSFDDFIECSDGTKGMAAIKASGKYRQEGKNYIVADGDVGVLFII
jgi:ribosome-binding ATPase YchF (GTP1/OBG family)